MQLSEPLWFNKPRVLLQNPGAFFPTREQTPSEHVNAMVRLVLYIAGASFAYNRDPKTLYLALAAIAIVSFVAGGRHRGGTAAGATFQKCRTPTADNPFMNSLIGEVGHELPPPPCQYDTVKTEIKKHFDTGLFKNIEDLYEKENSQREFLTVPNGGLPPDTKAFAEFCYAPRRNCKTTPSQCTGYE